VIGSEHPFQTPRLEGDERMHGPGVADLKGGMLVMYLALAALERSPWREQIGWEVLWNPDEEIGSQSSAPLLAEAAGRNAFGLIYEPAYPDGGLASARKGSGNFDLVVRGRAAHAGRDPHLGRNAIRAAADFIAALDRLNGTRQDLTINPGYVRGGGALNIVPDTCVFKFNVRTSAPGDECWMQEQLDRLLQQARREGIEFELRGGFTRPPKAFAGKTERLAGLLTDCGRELGITLPFRPTGGCCDGNNLAAHGLPNIDNLGVVGGEIHSEREYMLLGSLPQRAKLSALLLLKLASGALNWN
jgi:glutamate carboxypeptidase